MKTSSKDGKKKVKWTHYAFIDHLTKTHFEIWWHPTQGHVDMFKNGVLKGHSKKCKKGLFL